MAWGSFNGFSLEPADILMTEGSGVSVFGGAFAVESFKGFEDPGGGGL